MTDYSAILLEARNNLKLYEASVIKRNYEEAYEQALSIFAEARLLVQITKDMKDG